MKLSKVTGFMRFRSPHRCRLRVDPLRVPLFRFAPIPFLYALLTLPLEGVGESGGKASTSITYPIVL